MSSASNSSYGDQGGRFDVVTGMNRFGERDYNPSNAIWIEPDPAGYMNGINYYQPDGNNPIARVDPSGDDFIALGDNRAGHDFIRKHAPVNHYSLSFWKSCVPGPTTEVNKLQWLASNSANGMIVQTASIELFPDTWQEWRPDHPYIPFRQDKWALGLKQAYSLIA
jgi:RHS repeat-associated protein